MKVLFLDVDGVLNINSASYNSHGYDNLGNYPIELHLMKRLEFILERVPELKIIISSSWFEKQLIRKLEKLRFKYVDRIIGRTYRDKRWRGEQIQHALDFSNGINDYIVVDDEVEDICGCKCNVVDKKHVMHVDMNEGLTNRNALDIIIRINKLAEYDEEIYKASLRNINKFIDLGYRPSVDISKVTEDNNPFETFEVNNGNLSLLLTRRDK